MQGMMVFGMMLQMADRFSGPLHNAAVLVERFGAKAEAVASKPILPDIHPTLKQLSALRPLIAADEDAARRFKDQLRQVNEQGDRLKEVGQQTMMIGATLGAAAYGVGRMVRGALDPVHQVRESLNAIETIAPGTFGSVQADLDAVGKAAREWSLNHRDSADSFVKSSYRMLSALGDTRKAIPATEQAMALARATMGDASAAGNLLALTYSAIGDKTKAPQEEFARLADIVAATQQKFLITDLDQLQQGLQYGIPVAKQMGIEFSQMSAALGLLNNQGLQGSMAGTAFASAMARMIPAANKLRFSLVRSADGGVDLMATLASLQKRFEGKLGLDKTQTKLREAFGDEGVRAVTMLLGSMGELKTGMDVVRDSAGTVQRSLKTMEQGGQSEMDVLRNGWTDLKSTFGVGLEPSVGLLMGGIGAVTVALSEFGRAHPIIMKVAGGFTVVLGSVLAVGAALTAVAGSVLVAVGTRTKFLTLLTEHGFGRVRATIQALEHPLGAVRAGIGRVGGAARSAGEGIDGAVAGLRRMDAMTFGKLLGQIALVTAALAAAAALIKDVYDYYQSLKNEPDKIRKNAATSTPMILGGGANFNTGFAGYAYGRGAQAGAAFAQTDLGKALGAAVDNSPPVQRVRVNLAEEGLLDRLANAWSKAWEGRPTQQQKPTTNVTIQNMNLSAEDANSRDKVVNVFRDLALEAG